MQLQACSNHVIGDLQQAHECTYWLQANKAHERSPGTAFITHLSFLALIMSSILLAAAQWALFHCLTHTMAIGNLACCHLPPPLLHLSLA